MSWWEKRKLTFAPEPRKLTLWERIKMLFGWRKYHVPEFKYFTMPLIKADAPNLNRNVFTEQCLTEVVKEFDLLSKKIPMWQKVIRKVLEWIHRRKS